MKYLSLFSGIGGFELGIQQAYESNNEHALISEKPEQEECTQGGIGSAHINESLLHDRNRPTPFCIGFSEIDKYATQIYQSHFPNHKNYGDITKINADELPDFDFLCGGFPCQSFSIAGKRGGFADTRGTLFFDIARILKVKQPRLFLLENVKGLLSHDNGNTFKTIISTLDELGYDLQWQVLNSKNFGVPQNRERVFIVGHLRGTSRPEVFPIGHNSKEITELLGQYSNTLTARYYGGQANGTYVIEGELNAQEINVVGTLETDGWEKRNESTRRVYGTDGIAPTIPTAQGGGVMAKVAIGDYRYDEGLRIRKNNISPTIRAEFKSQDHSKSALVIEDMKIRRLTPTECMRLQGFPDNWCDGISDTQKYKCAGNAVTVNVIQAIMEKLL